MQLRKLCLMLGALLVLLCVTVPVAQAQETDGVTGDVATSAAVDATATELLVYDLNRVVTINDRGFPRDQPPLSSANGNWKTPVNFAEGTLYFRVEIRRQPQPQPMQLQFCVWQDKFALENCGPRQSLTGNAGTVVTWSKEVNKMWKKGGRSIDWSRARMRYGIAIKNRVGLPVSSVKGWNWNGENPALWYPMDMRFTVVVVAKGATFGGWTKYVGAGAVTAAASETELTEEAWSALVNDENYGSSLTPDGAAEQDNAGQALENQLYLPLVSMQ